MEKNPWRYATYALGLLCCVLFIFSIFTNLQSLNFEKEDFQIGKEDFKNIMAQYDVGDSIKLCDFDNHCINVKKLE